MKTYFLVRSGDDMPRWCELALDADGQSVWIDFKGRKTSRRDGRVLAHVEGDNVNATIEGVPEEVARLERDLAFIHLLDPWSNQGWVSPDGRFYGCDYYAHDDIAHALIRMRPAQLEALGWVRVHADSFRMIDGPRGMTRRQEDTLAALGFVDPAGYGRREPYEPDRSAPPRFAVRRPSAAVERPAAHPVPPAKDSYADRSAGSALDDLIRRLGEDGDMARLLDGDLEIIPEVGPGSWHWMLRLDRMDFGGPEDPSELAASPGLHLRVTSFDTVEVLGWHEPGLHLEPGARRMILDARGAVTTIRAME